MKEESARPIPIPLAQRWRDARMRLLPLVIFGTALCTIAGLWKQHVAAPTMVGQAEPVVSNVTCHKAGMLAELSVTRFQRVKTGDPVGQVLITDPKILASSLAVAKAEIDLMRSNLKPIISQQRVAVSYSQARLDWMRDRAQLASAQVSLQEAEADYHRFSELFKDQIVSQRQFEQAKAARAQTFLLANPHVLKGIVRVRDRGMSEAEMSGFMRWLQQDPQHAEQVEVVDYTHSGMVTGDPAEVVSYAGVRITKGPA